MDSRSPAPGPIHSLMTCCATHVCIRWNVFRVEHSCWPSLCHCSPPSLDPGCSTLCSNCHNCLLARHVILHDFLYMVLGPVRTSSHPTIWLRKVGLLSSQSEPWVDAICSLKIEHPRRAENQALASHRCSVEHVLLHALVKNTIQLALQHTFAYTRYNRVFCT